MAKLTEQQRAEFDEQGYLYLPGCFREEEVAVLRTEAEEIYKSDRKEVWRESSGAPNPTWVVLLMLMIILATISTNTAANVVSPTNSFQNIAPKYINETKGVLLTGFIGIALMSWELAKKLGWLESDVSVESLYSNWLLGYSSLLGPIAGIMIVDYFVIRKQLYELADLYISGRTYPDWHIPGLVAFFVPVGLTLVAIFSGSLSWFYDYGWFTGSFLGGLIYWLMCRGK